MFDSVGRSRMSIRVLLILILMMVAGGAPVALVSAQNPFSNGGPPIVATQGSVCTPRLDASDKGDRYIVAVDELNLRSGPSTDCDIVAELKRDTELYTVGQTTTAGDYTWVPVSTSAGPGYVIQQSIQAAADGSSCKTAGTFGASTEDGFTAGAVNLRSGPGLGCSVLVQLNAGTPVSVLGATLDADGETWLPVSTPMGNGYIVKSAFAPPGSWEAPAAVAVLMYHDIADNYNRFVVAPWQLEQQLIWLRDNGYTSITPRDLVAFLDHGTPLPPRPVILSVDDGWASTRIFRDLLTAYGFRGTYMLPNYAELTPDEIYQLNQSGEVCGHSVSHPFLDQLSWDGQYYEIVENKAWLDSITGVSTTCFAYPFGAFSDVTTQIVIDAGYRIAFHAWDGIQWLDYLDRWHVTRIEVSGEWDISTFAAVVSF
jgi:peptidoglycan/xylan/chitin deacetylase (PgdA/CDA1 family)/uncharacterized protein YgiM (DUF1202 family)